MPNSEIERAIAWLTEQRGAIENNLDGLPKLARSRSVLNDHVEYINTILTALQAQIKSVDGSTSDGYHTFDELYHHRAVLFASLCKAHSDKAWRSKKHHDGSMFGDDWFICGIATPDGQYSYHYRISEYWPMFDCCKTIDFAPEWDGHQPKDVDRVLSLQAQIKPECEVCKTAIFVDSVVFYKSELGNLHYTRVNKSKICPNCGRELKGGE